MNEKWERRGIIGLTELLRLFIVWWRGRKSK